MADKIYMIGRDSVPEKIVLGAGDALRATFVALPGVSAEVSLEVGLAGEGAALDLAGLYVCPSAENVRLRLNVRHLAGGCTSRQNFKGIVGGRAQFDFNGLIYVAHGAEKTEAYQENHTLLLSTEAVAQTSPQLEIYADDVICSHGATVGSLNEDEQFYMRSRGIPEAEARRLQTISFLSPVLGRLPEDLQEEIVNNL